MNRDELAELWAFRLGLPVECGYDIVRQMCYDIVDCEGDMDKIKEVLRQYYLDPCDVLVSII